MHLRVARHELEAALVAAADPGTLELRIGALPLTLVKPLPGALARLRWRLPQVHVYLSEDTLPNLFDWRREDTAVTLVWREASLGNSALVALLECF